jgi:hypothetical protein
MHTHRREFRSLSEHYSLDGMETPGYTDTAAAAAAAATAAAAAAA